MKRLRVLFAIPLLLLFFPLWRSLDYQAMIFSSKLLYTASLSLITVITILVPLKLLTKFKPLRLVVLQAVLTTLVYLSDPLSIKATRHEELNHCGVTTFTGVFYRVRAILPPAMNDDVEVRNQMCWVRKMVMKSPEEIEDVRELQNYLELLRQRLLSPPQKYKATLPLIAFLHGKMSANISGTAFESVHVGKMFLDSLYFWKSQYTVEISELRYSWYDWPYSAWIQWEYGLIEKNWETIVSGIEITP